MLGPRLTAVVGDGSQSHHVSAKVSLNTKFVSYITTLNKLSLYPPYLRALVACDTCLQSYHFSSNVYSYSQQTNYDTSGSAVMSLDLYTDTNDVISVSDLNQDDLFEIALQTTVSCVYSLIRHSIIAYKCNVYADTFNTKS